MVIATTVLAGKLPIEAILVDAVSHQLGSSCMRGRRLHASIPSVQGRHFGKSGKTFRHQKVLCCSENSCYGENARSAPARDRNDSEVMLLARQAFCKEVSLHKCDDAVSLIKGALLISAEDQAFISLNREKDNLAVQNEISHAFVPSPATRARRTVDSKDVMVGDLSVAGWMKKIDTLVAEVENHLNGDGRRWRPLHILKAVNVVLYKAWDFTRTSSSSDPFQSYMDHALTFGSGTGVLLGIIYMEVCRRSGVKMEGAAVEDSFLVWPLLDDSAQMVFEPCKGGKSWMIEDFSQCRSSTSSQRDSGSSISRVLTLSVVQCLEAKSNRDILGFVLRSLKNVYWKRAVKARPGLTPDSALQPYMSSSSWAINNAGLPVGAMLRPEDLRLAVMASERLVLLEPRNWATRKEYGMLLYHSRRYDEAVLELSICMALAPLPEQEVLQPFVERLHLMRMESTWDIYNSFNSPSAFV